MSPTDDGRAGRRAGRRREGRPEGRTEGRAEALAQVGLTPGEQVRFRRRDGARWTPATVERLERDGSVGLRDPKGAAVAIPIDGVEVRCSGRRGGQGWEPLRERLARNEQLRLL
jgi:hypothetical protein